MCHWCCFGFRVVDYAGESEVPLYSSNDLEWRGLIDSSRWLIDVGREDHGKRVLVDLHGGDMADEQARLEFEEIKDKVLDEV